MSPKPNPPLLVIVGETATGKSSLGLELAKRLNGEIICADSWTVRREVNIGTGKSTPKEREIVKHHLLDIVEPCSDFTAAVYKRLAIKAIEDISSRGKLAIMVGGSGLYIDSVIFDYQFLKAGDRKLRDDLNKMTTMQLLNKIEELDLPLRDNIDKGNKRRLIRVIESGGLEPQKGSLRENTLIIGLKVAADRHQELITNRVDQMLEDGLESEVRALYQKYGWDCEALKGVGYKQWQGYFQGKQTLDETRLQILSATNNLAKKQRTWFKRYKSIHWLLQPVDLDDIVDLVTTNLAI